MYNDRAFAIYACILVAAVGSMLTATIVSGIATIPAPMMFLEHLALSLGFRAAYKSLDGPAWWPYPSTRIETAAAEAAPALSLHHVGPDASGDDEYRDAA